VGLVRTELDIDYYTRHNEVRIRGYSGRVISQHIHYLTYKSIGLV
jgi:hypothetical protein